MLLLQVDGKTLSSTDGLVWSFLDLPGAFNIVAITPLDQSNGIMWFVLPFGPEFSSLEEAARQQISSATTRNHLCTI